MVVACPQQITQTVRGIVDNSLTSTCVTNPTDCCGSNITDICGHCTSYPSVWQINLSGITNAACSGCANLNGSVAVSYYPNGTQLPYGIPGNPLFSSGCFWVSAPIHVDPCSPGSPPFFVTLGTNSPWNGLNTWNINIFDSVGNQVAQWSLTPDSLINCSGSSTIQTPVTWFGGCSGGVAATIAAGSQFGNPGGLISSITYQVQNIQIPAGKLPRFSPTTPPPSCCNTNLNCSTGIPNGITVRQNQMSIPPGSTTGSASCLPAKTCPVGPCCGCAALPSQWQLTINTPNDFANDACSGCGILNNTNTYVLSYVSNCIWQSAPVLGICPTFNQKNLTFVLACSAGFGWSLQLTGIGGYGMVFFNNDGSGQIPNASFNCLGSNTFTFPRWRGTNDLIYSVGTGNIVSGSNVITNVNIFSSTCGGCVPPGRSILSSPSFNINNIVKSYSPGSITTWLPMQFTANNVQFFVYQDICYNINETSATITPL